MNMTPKGGNGNASAVLSQTVKGCEKMMGGDGCAKCSMQGMK